MKRRLETKTEFRAAWFRDQQNWLTFCFQILNSIMPRVGRSASGARRGFDQRDHETAICLANRRDFEFEESSDQGVMVPGSAAGDSRIE